MSYLDPPVDPYDPSLPDPEPQTIPMAEIIRRAIDSAGLQLKVCMPCVVKQVLGNQNVNIQPALQARYSFQDASKPNTATTLPVIQNVPVSMPIGNGYSIKLPVAVGDTGYFVCADRSLDVWLAGSGGIVDPQDSRKHDLSDAIFVPGLVPFSKQTTDGTTDLVITNGASVSRFMKNGGALFTDGVMLVKFNQDGTYVFSNGTNELMDLLVQITTQLQSLSNTLSNDTVNTIFGAVKLNSFATYQNIASQLNTLLTKLETLKGT